MSKKKYCSEFAGMRVLIFGGGDLQALALIKAYRRLGCFVGVYCRGKLDAAYNSRYPDEKILDAYNENDADATFEGIKRAVLNGRYEVVIPMNDFAAELLSEHKAGLSRYAYVCVNDPSVFSLARDKLRTMQLCDENNIPCPKTVGGGICDVSGLEFPLVIKPRSGFGAHGFRIIGDLAELERELAASQKQYGEMLVQEYIPKGGSQYQVEMYMYGGECMAAVIMDKLRWYPLDGGSSTLNVTVADAEIKNTCVRLMRLLGWDGYASLDLIRDPRDGVVKVLEINPRMNGTVKICYFSGVEMGTLFLRQARGLPLQPLNEPVTGRYLRLFLKDILWFVKSKERFRAKPSWFSFKNTTDEVMSLDDPLPFFAFAIQSFQKLRTEKSIEKPPREL